MGGRSGGREVSTTVTLYGPAGRALEIAAGAVGMSSFRLGDVPPKYDREYGEILDGLVEALAEAGLVDIEDDDVIQVVGMGELDDSSRIRIEILSVSVDPLRLADVSTVRARITIPSDAVYVRSPR